MKSMRHAEQLSSEVVEGNAGDASHLDVVDEAHEFVHDSLGEVGVLDPL